VIAYELPGGWKLLVGATDADNDVLSTRLALPDDWWFHADAVPGSHVILRADPAEEPDAKTLRQAAAVAAYHSKARAGGTVRVYCTKARHVKKRRGSEVGTVEVAGGKILKVRPDNSFAARIPGVDDVSGD
jgi:predicted ribosome quality control (RQC) complex YloA/Tae2 family protein